MFFPTVTELVENLIQIRRGLERSCGMFPFDPKIFLYPITKKGPNRTECSKDIIMRDEKSKTELLQLCTARCVSRKFDHTSRLTSGILKLPCQ